VGDGFGVAFPVVEQPPPGGGNDASLSEREGGVGGLASRQKEVPRVQDVARRAAPAALARGHLKDDVGILQSDPHEEVQRRQAGLEGERLGLADGDGGIVEALPRVRVTTNHPDVVALAPGHAKRLAGGLDGHVHGQIAAIHVHAKGAVLQEQGGLCRHA